MSNERILDKITALLVKAGRDDTPEHERELCQQRADEMMTKYRIEMSMLSFTATDKEREVITHEVNSNVGTDFDGDLNSMMVAVFRHCGTQIARPLFGKFTAVGYESDLQYAEMMWASIYMHFISRMLPGWSPDRTFDHNVYLLKESGKSWMEIVHTAPAEEGLNANSGARLRGAYGRWAEQIGAPTKAQPRNPKGWRESFVEGYSDRLRHRLWEMAVAAKETVAETPGAGLAIIKDSDRVDRAFWDMFPDYDPAVRQARSDAYAAAEAARLAARTPAEVRADEREAERSQRAWERHTQTKAYREGGRKVDYAGRSAGRSAANEVSLSGGNEFKGRKGEIG